MINGNIFLDFAHELKVVLLVIYWIDGNIFLLFSGHKIEKCERIGVGLGSKTLRM